MFKFAYNTKLFVKKLPRNISNIEYAKQLIRSSGSVAANYIEASESLSKKDFVMRIKICRKEAKESVLWLRLVDALTIHEAERKILIDEATQLMKIFGAIISKI
ncbi:MAG: four helix bundle protein [Candidatus Magasanikbacteria bacterium RIFOXYC2_FULL_42_28]|uniref:Four helix bundle protein n=1 Tax=Candidatus Magasanikbacteria bacterium RIFOXYC2_FULL_42_28 TaxID=1798704 RepID=A0A1F6NY28_9BACT|nr:MAG: four helix bundle protein [Candidatus Magasanikbacteria bacterium RIFOXYC2_FULL_42_28]